MAVLTYGPHVTLFHVQCTPIPTRWNEMMYHPDHTWMTREKDIDRPLIYNPREEKNPLPVTRNISFPVRIYTVKLSNMTFVDTLAMMQQYDPTSMQTAVKDTSLRLIEHLPLQ